MFIELHLLPDEENELGESIFINVQNIAFIEDKAYDDSFPDSCKVYVNHNNMYWFYVQDSYDTVKRMIKEALENVRNT